MFCHFYFDFISQLKMNLCRTDVKSYFMLLRVWDKKMTLCRPDAMSLYSDFTSVRK
jgi:hypothetical protein